MEELFQSYSTDLYIARPLVLNDYNKNFLSVLEQLTDVGVLSESTFNCIFQTISANPNHHVIVFESRSTGNIVAAGTLLLEIKFLHQGGLYGHIEDIVVSKKLRGSGAGTKLIKLLLDIARLKNAWKVVLDCKPHLRKFYSGCGLHEAGLQFSIFMKPNL